MGTKIVERFCIALVLMQILLFWNPTFSREAIGDWPKGMIFISFGLMGFFSAVIGLGILLKRLIKQQSLGPELLLACGLTFTMTAAVQTSFGWQNLDFSKANDFSTDSVNAPQFHKTKHQRLFVKQKSWLASFFYIPHQITKADTDSITLSLSALNSKIVLKRVFTRSGWRLSRHSISSTADEFSETYEYRGANGAGGARGAMTGLTDLSVRIVSTEPGFSVIDIRSSSRLRFRDLGVNSFTIRKLASDILVMAEEFDHLQNVNRLVR